MPDPLTSWSARSPVLGLRENWRQFWLLVLINAFVGAMVGLERTVLPLLAEREFGLASKSAALSFIATFGVVKAITNLVGGRLGDRFGRKRVLVAGWLIGIPVPFLVMWAPTWTWIVFANALLGVNQGLAWSATVIMKIDLVGPKRRGLAMGLNEFAGYLALAGAALASGVVATTYGLRTGPAAIGVVIALVGLFLSVVFVAETQQHAHHEQRNAPGSASDTPGTAEVIRRSMWSDKGLFSVSQAGLVNNLNDGLAWGVFPLLFASAALSIGEMSALVALYPAVWGVCQLGTGPLSDRWGRKWPIVIGMVVQGIALLAMTQTRGMIGWSGALIALGIGTALVYPTLLAAVGDIARPSWRGVAVGVYRLWRDLGYVVGAVLAGIVADVFGVAAAIETVGILTILSGLLVALRFEGRRSGGGAS